MHSLAVSIASVHYFYPLAEKLVVLPHDEQSSFWNHAPKWAASLIRLLPLEVTTESHSPLVRSRWIKTHSLGALQTDAVLLDADTLMVGHLKCETLFDAVGAARDRVASNFQEFEYLTGAQNKFKEAGWDWLPKHRTHYNSGVITYRNTSTGRMFAEAWPEAWEDFLLKTGTPYDQPAFNLTVHSLECCEELPVAYNAPVAILPSSSVEAKIYHYYSTGTTVDQLFHHKWNQTSY